jgi:hypothetical protein
MFWRRERVRRDHGGSDRAAPQARPATEHPPATLTANTLRRRAIMSEEPSEAHKQRRRRGRVSPLRRPRDGGDWHPAFAGMTIGPTSFDRDPFLILIQAPEPIGAPSEPE